MVDCRAGCCFFAFLECLRSGDPVVWEYNIHTTLNGDNNYQLSQLGAQGWELVSVRSDEEMMNNTRIIKVHYYLKRVKP
jgi:hypothetical protein